MVVEEVGRLAEISGLDSDYRHLELGQLQPQHLCCDQWSHWSHLSQWSQSFWLVTSEKPDRACLVAVYTLRPGQGCLVATEVTLISRDPGELFSSGRQAWAGRVALESEESSLPWWRWGCPWCWSPPGPSPGSWSASQTPHTHTSLASINISVSYLLRSHPLNLLVWTYSDWLEFFENHFKNPKSIASFYVSSIFLV